MRRAFTLVELLVVVTIIVILLSLLAPAMSKAIHQAQMLKCGAGPLRMMSSGVLQYTLDYKRRYPDRDIEQTDRRGTVTYLPAMALAYPAQGFDSRPALRTIFSINQAVQCPMNEPVEMDDTEPDINIEASYMMFWGWQYKPENRPIFKGMMKLGDRFEWGDPGRPTYSYNVLASDMDFRYGEARSIQGSHPDREPSTMYPLVAVEAPGFWPRNNTSRWVNAGQMGDFMRGLVDLNFAYDDGSVSRLVDVIGWRQQDERVDRIPLQYDVVRYPTDALHVPAGN